MGRKRGNQSLSVEIEEEVAEKDNKNPYPYPYPSHVNVSNFVSVKLSGEDDYNMWKAQMMCLIEAHDMLDFVLKTFKQVFKNNKKNRDVNDEDNNNRLWRRSDTLVRGWILGSLTKDVIDLVLDLQTARNVWQKLETTFGLPTAATAAPARIRPSTDKKDLSDYMPLHKAAQKGNWDEVEKIFENDREAVTSRVNKSGYTALHIAVGTRNPKICFMEKLVKKIPSESLPKLQTCKKQNPLHIAAIVGNTEAVKILLKENTNLLYAKDRDGFLPIHRAVFNSQRQTFILLLQETENNLQQIQSMTMTFGKDMMKEIEETPFLGQSGVTLLSSAILAGYYDVALYLVKKYHGLATTIPSDTTTNDAPLMAIAKKANAFYSGTNYNFVQRLIYSYVPVKKDFDSGNANHDDIESQVNNSQEIKLEQDSDLSPPLGSPNFFNPVHHVKRIEKDKLIHRQALQLVRYLCKEIEGLKRHSSYGKYYTDPTTEAARNGAYEIVQEIVETFPEAVWCKDKYGYNIIQLAVLHRCEKVYNLMVYHMSDHTHFYKTVKDRSRNNILHLAGRLAPKHKIDAVSGAALQMQRELQWFQEVSCMNAKFLMAKNSDKETPKMVFSREHKELVKEGEDWMKNTANSYTITATLIVTVVFAAAITVPGGTNSDTGQPIYNKRNPFIIFAISDAISLFTSTTSLLLFLSILTERYAEHDFLFTLPVRLMFGLAMLFLSTVAMVTAFSATLYLMFGRGQEWILIPIVLLACLPISSFVTLQVPLLVDLVSSTFGHGIFGKQE